MTTFFQSLIQQVWLKRWIGGRRPVPDTVVVESHPTFSLQESIEFFQNAGWLLKQNTKEDAWKTIPKVVVERYFYGCGFVEGRTTALLVNEHLQLVEADEDLTYSEYCILRDGTPYLMMHLRSGRGLTVSPVYDDPEWKTADAMARGAEIALKSVATMGDVYRAQNGLGYLNSIWELELLPPTAQQAVKEVLLYVRSVSRMVR